MAKKCLLGQNDFMKRYFIILICILFNLLSKNSIAQFSINDYLSNAKNDIRLNENKAKTDFLQDNPYRSPILQRLEFRARTNSIDILEDDYRLRIGPTNPSEIKANKKYYQLETNSLIFGYQYALNKALYERYQLILRLLSTLEKNNIKEKEILLQNDQIKILESELSNKDFDISEYIEQKENLMALVFEMNRLRHNRDKLLLKIRSQYPFTGDITLASIDMIGMDQIQGIMNLFPENLDTVNNIHIENLNQKAILYEQRIRIEKAEGRRNIGYIQAEYDRLKGDEFTSHLGVQIGIRIPITNLDRPDLNRRTLRLMEDKTEIIEEKTLLEVRCDLLRLDLNYLFDQLKFASTHLNDRQLVQLLNQDINLKPKGLLKAQKSILRMQKMESDLKWSIYNTFIDYLYYSGKLVEMPLKNYISRDLYDL